MCDHGWNTQFTEFDIVEEGDVPLLMSLPQMTNLGFQSELILDKAYLSCARIGMRRMALRTAISTHLILDLQDVAWYMSQVNFKTPQVKSIFSKQYHFEYSQVAVQQDVQHEEALVTGDCWQVDPLRRELTRPHKDKRQYLHEMTRSPAPPIPKDQLHDDREIHIEYQDGKKGATVYKIKDGYEIPDDVAKTDIERNAKRLRGSIDDVFQPQQSSPSQPSGVQSKPSSSQKEVGKSSGPRFKKVEIEVGPPAAKRHVGKQKPVVVVPLEGSSSKKKKKKVVASYPQEPDELDRIAKEMGLEDVDAEPVEHPPSVPVSRKQDSESRIQKLGSDALEPRRLSVPLPGSEVQAMRKLEDSVELYKLHIKHYHMSPTQFRRRTSMLGIPDSVHEKHEDVVNKCRVCSTSVAPPPRARVSGIRSSNFGDVIFGDYAEITLKKNKYIVLLVLDGASNLLWATAQNLMNKETIQALRSWTDENHCMPKAIVGDEAFFQEYFLAYCRTQGSKECPCVMAKSLEDDRCKNITIREAVKRTVWARNTQLTIGDCYRA
eukprot:s116_g22.t1